MPFASHSPWFPSNLEGNVAVVIASCDLYSDVWDAFFTLFFRYWPDCPWPVFLIANRLRYEDPRVQTIQIQADRHWAGNMRIALDGIHADNILYLQEDYLFKSAVNTARLRELAIYMKANDIGCIRLYDCPKPDKPWPERMDLGLIGQHAPYRVSLQAAFWNRDVLYNLLIDGENGWEMEREGSLRSQTITKPFLSIKRSSPPSNQALPIPYFCTAVVNKRWLRGAATLCAHEGIAIDTAKRPIETLWQERKREYLAKIERRVSPLIRLLKQLQK